MAIIEEKCGWMPLLIYIYRTGRLVNIPELGGWTPLHYACSKNDKDLVQQLLNAGADPNARYYSVTS